MILLALLTASTSSGIVKTRLGRWLSSHSATISMGMSRIFWRASFKSFVISLYLLRYALLSANTAGVDCGKEGGVLLRLGWNTFLHVYLRVHVPSYPIACTVIFRSIDCPLRGRETECNLRLSNDTVRQAWRNPSLLFNKNKSQWILSANHAASF